MSRYGFLKRMGGRSKPEQRRSKMVEVKQDSWSRAALLAGIAVLLSGVITVVQASQERVSSARMFTMPSPMAGGGTGEEPRLVRWVDLLSELRELDRQSERLEIREIGRTREGRSQVALFISAPPNLRGLNRLAERQRKIKEGSRSETIDAPVMIALTAGIDPREADGTLVAGRILKRLLTEQTAAVRDILDRVVIIIIPSLDPDGADRVASHFTESVGVRLQDDGYPINIGGEMDLDFDTFSLVETQIFVDKVLNQWRPEVWVNLRESGRSVFNPRDLISPRVARCLGAGPHGASVARIGSPERWSCQHATLYFEVSSRDRKRASTLTANGKQPDPGRSGLFKWSTEHERQAAAVISILDNIGRKRDRISAERRRIQDENLKERRPFAYIIPEPAVPESISRAYQQLTEGLREVTGDEGERHDRTEALYNEALGEPSTGREIRYFYQTEGLDRMLAILKRGRVEVRRADEPFKIEGRSWPAGTHLVMMNQPDAQFARDLLDPLSAGKGAMSGGQANLPLLLNVEVVRVGNPFQIKSRPEPMALVIQERVRENGGVRVALYSSGQRSSDERWIRLLFDQYRFGYTVITPQETGDPGLSSRFDSIILPDQDWIFSGDGGQSNERGKSRKEAATIGGAGARALRAFVESGGTLITFNRASLFAVRQFSLPVRHVPIGKSKGSGNGRDQISVLRLEVDPADPLSLGIGRESIACFENGPAFEILDPRIARVIARYPAENGKSLPLEPQYRLRGQAALVEVKLGSGRIILFGFRPLYRGRSLTNYPFVFNALMTSGRLRDQ